MLQPYPVDLVWDSLDRFDPIYGQDGSYLVFFDRISSLFLEFEMYSVHSRALWFHKAWFRLITLSCIVLACNPFFPCVTLFMYNVYFLSLF